MFPFLMFNLNFFSIGCAVNHHRQLFNVQRYGSPVRHQTPVDALPIGEDFLQQTSAIRDWVFYKNLYRLFGLLPYWATIFQST